MNGQLTVVRTLGQHREQLLKKQEEESVELEKLKKLQESLLQQTEYLMHFREQWEALQPELHKARELDIRLQTLKENIRQSEDTLNVLHKQTIDSEEKQRLVKVELDSSCISLSKLLKKDVSLSVDLQQIEETVVREEQQLLFYQKENDNRVSDLNAFGIQSIGEEQNRLLQQQALAQRTLQASRLLTDLRAKQAELSTQLAVLTQQLTDKAGQLNVLQHIYENARLAMSQNVIALRHNLHAGEACPVCGSLSHPYGIEGSAVDTLYHSVEKEYKAASEVYKQMNDREIALQRDIRNLIDQQKFQEEIVAAYPGAEPSKDYLNTLLKELTQRLHELEG